MMANATKSYYSLAGLFALTVAVGVIFVDLLFIQIPSWGIAVCAIYIISFSLLNAMSNRRMSP